MNNLHPEMKKQQAGLTMVDIGVVTVDTMDIPTMVDIMDGDARRGTLKKLSGMILVNPRLKADLMDTMAGVDMAMVVIVATMDILTIVVMVMDIGDVRRDPLRKLAEDLIHIMDTTMEPPVLIGVDTDGED